MHLIEAWCLGSADDKTVVFDDNVFYFMLIIGISSVLSYVSLITKQISLLKDLLYVLLLPTNP